MRSPVFIFIVMIIAVMATLGVGKVFYDEGYSEEFIKENVSSKLTWNETIFQQHYKNTDALNVSYAEVNTFRITNIILKIGDSIGWIMMEVARFGVEEGYKNPQIDWIFAMKVLAWWCVLVSIVPIGGLIIVLAALVYVIIQAICNLYRRLKKKK